MTTPDWKILGPLMAGLVALFGWLAKHISNSRKHPCADKLVYSDVCEQVQRRLEDCIEGEVRRSTERYEALDKSLDEVKQLIRDMNR